MRRIALHEYLDQIEGLLNDNRLPEAAAHSHFILQQYPRHIGAYRLFGRALLEQQLYDDAIDVFERLVNADPEDLMAHAGLAVAYSESRDLERAIWHMERAFEIDPYSGAVQNELRKLYVARDGDAPTRIALTGAALARLHSRAALYQLAAAEFARLVAASPERVDLRLALADTLYRDARIPEAAAMCQPILETRPYCTKANAIVADALLRDERINEARPYLRKVQDLTMLDLAHLEPDTTLGQALGNLRITLPESVQVEVLEDTLSFAKGFEATGAWPEPTVTAAVAVETAPDWLYELDSPEAELAVARLPEEEQASEPAEAMDWLDELETTEIDLPVDRIEGASVDLAAAIEAVETETGQEEKEVADPEYPLLAMDESLDGDLIDVKQTEPEAPMWEDEQLLALQELRSYIDDDHKAVISGGGAPDWLDELSGAEVSDELPDWLHEAVGFEVRNSGTGEASASDGESHGREPALSEAVFDEAEDEHGLAGIGLESEPSYLEHEPFETAEKPEIPDWLLAADDVLEELPGELLVADLEGNAAAGAGQEDTMSWLDELSAQLASGADLLAGPTATPGSTWDDEESSQDAEVSR